MKNNIALLIGFAALIFTSCDTSDATDVNTERFYTSPWNARVEREHDVVGSVPAQEECYNATVVMSKDGNFKINNDSLGNHQFQHWGYSWSTDQFFMNWAPCTEWSINEAEDSMYLEYQYNDYDDTSGINFYWDYEIYLTR